MGADSRIGARRGTPGPHPHDPPLGPRIQLVLTCALDERLRAVAARENRTIASVARQALNLGLRAMGGGAS